MRLTIRTLKNALAARLNRLLKNAVCWRNVEPQRLKPAPFQRLTVCLKAYPDTNPEFFRTL
jgi:hypothetical protein